MDNHPPRQRATKRRRTGKGRRVIADGDEITADGILVRSITRDSEQGPVQAVHSRPVWLKDERTMDNGLESSPANDTLNPAHNEEIPTPFLNDTDVPNMDPNDLPPITNAPGPRTQQHYLNEFVQRGDALLTALLSRESLSGMKCQACPAQCLARWRCRDCTCAMMLCRACMRKTHTVNPLHHIEIWTGTHFRRAELWQVGLYILVPHHTGERLCPTLTWNETLLDAFQVTKDVREQTQLTRLWGRELAGNQADEGASHLDDIENLNGQDGQNWTMDEPFEPVCVANEGAEAGHWDGEDVHEPKEDIGEDEEYSEDQDMPLEPPVNYLPPRCGTSETQGGTADMDAEIDNNMPRSDALDNPFIRVIHTNGIHSIAVVSCSCRGRENTHSDLMASRLIPTSFVRYQTMFTHAALDDFRLTNLECKVSAYQYFQKLRRLTSAMLPDSVPNLYHELRRMSRQWRWIKKLKWSGTASRTEETMIAKAGSLANFCPACPQPGINLPDDWKLDPQKYETKHVD
jgi:hypothetical protein